LSPRATPIAWNGLVFIGNAGGDFKGGKGHMYALDAKTGKIVWQFFLVPKAEGDIVRGPEGASPLDGSTWNNILGAPISGGGAWTSTTLDPATGLLYVPVGNPAPDFDNSVRPGDNLFTGSVVVLDATTGAYKNHFQLVPRDWHEWDVSNPPILINMAGGKRLMAESPKDGHLYAFDLADNKLLYRTPVTRIENVEEPFAVDKDVHFCPGAAGGAEWNSPAYDPLTNLIFTPDIEWRTTVRLQTREKIAASPLGQPWTGEKSLNPFNEFGEFTRADRVWAGWLYATDADTGSWKWRLQSNYRIFSAVTSRAGFEVISQHAPVLGPSEKHAVQIGRAAIGRQDVGRVFLVRPPVLGAGRGVDRENIEFRRADEGAFDHDQAGFHARQTPGVVGA
jgi:alcohol dehydrogenase (cytochrome c)